MEDPSSLVRVHALARLVVEAIVEDLGALRATGGAPGGSLFGSANAPLAPAARREALVRWVTRAASLLRQLYVAALLVEAPPARPGGEGSEAPTPGAPTALPLGVLLQDVLGVLAARNAARGAAGGNLNALGRVAGALVRGAKPQSDVPRALDVLARGA
jgi:hypothetical protein